MIPIEALKTKEGAAYLAGAAVCLLIAGGLVVTGVQRFLLEEDLRAAVRAFHRDDNDARQRLVSLKEELPDDATVRVLLGCHLLERADGDADNLGAAERLFEEAVNLQPNRTSAHLGLAVARLKLAAMKPREGRAQAAHAAGEALERAGLDRAQPDVAGLFAAVDLMRGRTNEALKVLEKLPTSISREGQTAWRWNRALACCLARRGDGLQDALAAFALRRLPIGQEQGEPMPEPGKPLPEPARLLSIAYRVALADDTAQPAGNEALLARCELARKALGVRSVAASSLVRGRFTPPGSEEAVVLNALGMAYARLERWPEAAQAFDDAQKLDKDESRYVLNYAEARRREALAIPPEDKARAPALGVAAEAFGRVADMLAGKEGREPTRILAATTGAMLHLQNKKAAEAANFYRARTEGHPNAAERARDLGALLDHAGSARCVEEYRQAVSLSHPDSAALERRIRVRSRGR